VTGALSIAAEAAHRAAGSLAVDDSSVSPGVLGFVVVALLGIATWLLIRSMNRQIRKIDIPEEEDADRPAEDEPGRNGGDRGGSPQG
jgi:hypothetical protein